MIKSFDNCSTSETYSDLDENYFNDSSYPSNDLDLDYAQPVDTGGKEVSDSELQKLFVDHYLGNELFNIVNDKPSFFLFQAELFLNLRMHRESLSSCLCFDRVAKENLVSKCIKMICFYQLNYTKNFAQLKDEILMSNLDTLSESLRKNVIGTIQVSTWIPEFMNCLNNMKKKKSSRSGN